MSVTTNDPRLAARALTPVAPNAGRTTAAKDAETEGTLGFDDLVDTLNPLHHLPGVSMVYGAVSDDTISLPARLAGGFLFGGPMGLAGSVALTVFEGITGDTVAGHLKSLFEDADTGAPTVAVAAFAAPAAPAPTAGSAAALAEALRRAVPDTPDAPAASTGTVRQDPVTLAKLYALEAVRPDPAAGRGTGKGPLG